MFPQRFKEQRLKKGLVMEKIAEELGVSLATVGSWEKGKRRPTIDRIGDIANFFDVSTEYILGYTDTPTRQEHSHDLDRILKEPDVHYKGKKVSQRDLEFVINYFDRIYGNEDPNSEEVSSEINPKSSSKFRKEANHSN